MPKKESPTRSKSDTLWRLTRVIPQKTFNALKAQAEATGKNEDKVKLLVWYRKLEDWSREEEKKKYKDEDQLKKLKYRTYQWLVTVLVEHGNYVHYDIDQMIAEIKIQMHFGCFPDVLSDIEVAKEECLKRELFFELLELLKIEITAVARSLLTNEQMERLIDIRAEIKKTEEKITDLERWEEVALRYRLRHMAILQHNGIGDAGLESEYKNRMSAINIDDCRSIRSKGLFHFNWIYLSVLSRDYELLLHHWVEFCKVEEDGWFLPENPAEYAGLILRVMGMASVNKDATAAFQVMEQIKRLEDSDELTTALTVDKLIFSFFFYSITFKDRDIGERACNLFESNKTMMRNRIKIVSYVWLVYYYAVHKFRIKSYQECEIIIDEFFKMRLEIKVDVQTHLRTFKLICAYMQLDNYSEFGVSCKAALKFVEGKDADTSVQLLVIETIEKLSKALAIGVATQSIWNDTHQSLTSLKSTGKHTDIFDTFDYESFWLENRDELTGPLNIRQP